MNDNEYRIEHNLPESLNQDNLKEVAHVIDEYMTTLDNMIELVNIYPNIDNLSGEMIDYLAVQFHVDYYDHTLPLVKRRQIVKNSIIWHMRKGTRGVVQEVVNVVFDSGIVREWYRYGGAPGCFRVDVLLNAITPESLKHIVKLINEVKNVRSWLEGIGFLREMHSIRYYGGLPMLHMKYTGRPKVNEDIDISAVRYKALIPKMNINKRQVRPKVTLTQHNLNQRYVGSPTITHFRYQVKEAR